VDDVAPNLNGKVATEGAGGRGLGVGGTNHGASDGNHAAAFPHHADDRSGAHVLDQATAADKKWGCCRESVSI
jgi:hypothetical protein